jgi:hypothetical protein
LFGKSLFLKIIIFIEITIRFLTKRNTDSFKKNERNNYSIRNELQFSKIKSKKIKKKKKKKNHSYFYFLSFFFKKKGRKKRN